MRVSSTILFLCLLVLPGVSCNRAPTKSLKSSAVSTAKQLPLDQEPVVQDKVFSDSDDHDNNISYGSSTEAPAGWPEFLPTYPDSTIVSSQRSKNSIQLSLMLGFESQDAPQKIYDYYVAKIEEQGFSQAKEIQDGAFLLSEFERAGTILQIQTAREKLRTMTFLTLAIPTEN